MHLERPAESCALAVEGCGCSLCISTPPHSEAFPFPSSFMEWFLLRALLRGRKKVFVSFWKDKSKTYIRFSLYSTHSFFFVTLDFHFLSGVKVMNKFHFTSLSLLILFYVEVFALPSPWSFFNLSFLFSSVKIQRDIWMKMPGTSILVF